MARAKPKTSPEERQQAAELKKQATAQKKEATALKKAATVQKKVIAAQEKLELAAASKLDLEATEGWQTRLGQFGSHCKSLFPLNLVLKVRESQPR
jgi:hypothetical protein